MCAFEQEVEESGVSGRKRSIIYLECQLERIYSADILGLQIILVSMNNRCRHENCLEHGQHAGGTIMEQLRNQSMAVNGKTPRLPQ